MLYKAYCLSLQGIYLSPAQKCGQVTEYWTKAQQRSNICHLPTTEGWWQKYMPVMINNKRYCQFTLYYISYSAFFLQVYSVFNLAAEHENICPQLAAKYFHMGLQALKTL